MSEWECVCVSGSVCVYSEEGSVCLNGSVCVYSEEGVCV